MAKSEIINNTKEHGFVVLPSDDNFFNLHKKITFERNLKILSLVLRIPNPI